MNTDTLLDRLRVANPTPESDRLDIDDPALLVAIDGRSASMTYQTERRATKRLPTFHDQEPPRTRKPVLVAAAAFTVVVAVGVAAALVAAGSEDRSLATTPQTTTPTPTTTPLLSSLSWSRVPHDEAVFGGAGEQSMSSVTVGGPGLVAVGTDGDAAVWTSPDGITWSRVAHDEMVFGGAGMSSVTVGGPGLVAVGTDGALFDQGHLLEYGDAAVWTSPGGITWSRVPPDEAVFGRAGMSSVTVGGPGLVAVGGPDSGAAVWASVDGITWSRVPQDEAVFGAVGDHEMLSVTVGGLGLVAVGNFSSNGVSRDGGHEDNGYWLAPVSGVEVWTCVDGISWSRVFARAGEQSMFSVTVGGPGLVAVGIGRDDAAVWVAVPND